MPWTLRMTSSLNSFPVTDQLLVTNQKNYVSVFVTHNCFSLGHALPFYYLRLPWDLFLGNANLRGWGPVPLQAQKMRSFSIYLWNLIAWTNRLAPVDWIPFWTMRISICAMVISKAFHDPRMYFEKSKRTLSYPCDFRDQIQRLAKC